MSEAATQKERTAGGLTLLWRLSHPVALLPICGLIVALVSRWDSLDIGHQQAIPLFLQGSTDWGGSITFAATMAMYVVGGILGGVQLALYLQRLAPATPFAARLLAGTLRLRLHWFLFLLGGTGGWSYDRRIAANDFRNMFVLAALLFALSACWITWLSLRPLPLRLKVALAPLLLLAWLAIGADGTTTKAGQVLLADVDPQVAPRGVRHGIMLGWHALCDRLLGDLAEPGDAAAARASQPAAGRAGGEAK